MANNLAAIMPKILARGLLALRERASMPRLVNGDYSDEAREKGDTIDVPISSAMTVIDVTPSNTPPAGSDTTPSKVQVVLSNWKQNSPFFLSDKDLVEIDRNAHFIPMQVQEAVRALAKAVNDSIFAEYKGVYGVVGTAGTTPFGSGVGVKSATDARKILNIQLCPRDQRRGMLDFAAEAAALALPEFSDADKVGDNVVKIEGEIGRKFGIDWYADDAVPTHTAGTGSGYLVNNGAGYAVGSTSIVVDTGTGTLVKGDIITFAGHTQTYAIQTDYAGGAGTITIYPGLKVAVADNVAITKTATHVVNMVFHRDAFAFATRPLASNTVEMALGNEIMSLQDPQTGLVLRLEVSRQYKRVAWEFDILWGAKLVRPELATRILG